MTKKENNSQIVEIPKSMWPIDRDLIDNLPEIISPSDEELINIQYPWELLVLLRKNLLDLIHENCVSKLAEVSDKAYLEGPIWIEEGARILPFAVIIGPSFIGKNTLVGNHTQVRASFVGNNSMIGAGTEFIRSICLNECTFHRTYVGDSLLGNNINIGGGSGLSNLRLDRANVQSVNNGQHIDTGLTKFGSVIGSNTTLGAKVEIMPGIKIGCNCMVGPGVILFKDLSDGLKIRVIQEQQIEQLA